MLRAFFIWNYEEKLIYLQRVILYFIKFPIFAHYK